MVLIDFLSRMEGDKSNPHQVIPISFNYHSILRGHYYASSSVPEEAYKVTTRSQTKEVGTQMTKVHEADKVVDPILKHVTQAKKKGRTQPIQKVPILVTQPQPAASSVQPRKGWKRVGFRRKITGPESQPIPQPQPKPTPLHTGPLYQSLQLQ